MTIGDLVKKYRDDNGISMDEFSKRCHLSKGYISMLENNINPRNNKPIAPTLPTIKKIAHAMHTDIDSILESLDSSQEISLDYDSAANHEVGKRIRIAREKLGITQVELGNIIGVTGSAITNYEKGTSHPKIPIIYDLMEALNVDANYLFQNVTKVPKKDTDLTTAEYELIKKYRDLDPFGQKTVNYILDRELERTKQLQEKPSSAAVRAYIYMNKIACAGTGFYFEDIPTEMIEAPYLPGADFIVGVSGDSMESTYSDGDLVYVQRCDHVEIGAVGIFLYDNECYIKEVGRFQLLSHNPEYKPMLNGNDVICIGKVLGKVEQ